MATLSIGRLRRDLYRGARVLGDVQAMRHGPTAMLQRAERRIVWRLVARLLRAVIG